jgi:HTH-type transcriptional regulator/antitoxin HipB
MPFQEIDLKNKINEKCKSDPDFETAYKEISAELDLIVQIVKQRKAKGLTQDDLAKKTGLTQQMISRIEKRTFSPSYKNILKIADALDTELLLIAK